MSTLADRPNLPEIKDLPTLAGAREDRRNLEWAMKLLAEGLAAGEIANARYKDAYFVLGRLLEDAWRATVMVKFPRFGVNDAADEAHRKYPFSPTFLRMEKPRADFAKMRDAEKDPKVRAIHDAAVEFYDECIPLSKVVLWARAHAVKRTAAPPPPPEDALPQATQRSRQLVRQFLSETLETVRAQYRNELIDRHIAAVDFIEKRLSSIELRDASDYGPQGLFFAAFDTFRDAAGKPAARRRADWREAVDRLVDRSVTITFRQFVEKNVEKLSAIVELKGGEPPERRLISATVSGGVLETRMSFVFPDSSSFEVMNQIVEQYSPLGRPYLRFPTTFHDVKFSDGSRLTQPSEAAMKTTFVGKEPDPDEEEPQAPSP